MTYPNEGFLETMKSSRHGADFVDVGDTFTQDSEVEDQICSVALPPALNQACSLL